MKINTLLFNPLIRYGFIYEFRMMMKFSIVQDTASENIYKLVSQKDCPIKI